MKYGLIVLFLILNISLSAQRKGRMIKDTIPDWSITFSPSAFLNEFAGIQFGVEKRFSQKWATELEYAYIFPQGPGALFGDDTSPEIKKKGFRLKLGIKKRAGKNFHLLLTLYLRKTLHDHSDTFSRFGGQFEQILDYQVTKTLIGPALGFVWDKPLGQKFGFELGGSSGIGNYNRKSTELPADVESLIIGEGFVPGFSNNGDDLYPILAFHMKLKFRLI